jgi:pectate lyase
MRTKLLLCIVIFIALTGSLSAQAVIDVTPGEDQISYALLNAYPGDILELAEGDYSETKTLETTIDITIRGAEGATVKWFVPTAIKEGIHVKGNLHLKNIIFHTDGADRCIVNMFGSVTAGQEADAVKNNIFVDHCQIIGFVDKPIWTPDPGDMPDGKAHPVDTLSVKNSLLYGGENYSIYQSIRIEYAQAKTVIVQNCTFWNTRGENIKAYGHKTLLDYFNLYVDHCTFFQAGTKPLPDKNGLGIYYKYADDNDTLRNCIMYDISDFAIKGSGGNYDKTYIDYHTAYECGWKPGCGACTAFHDDIKSTIGINCQTLDPMFENASIGDFRLKLGSPCAGSSHDGSDRGCSITVWKPGTWDHTPPTAVRENTLGIPVQFALNQNFPNPFNPSTTISYDLPRDTHVNLTVYDIEGRVVSTLVKCIQSAGTYKENWEAVDYNGRQLPSGIYFCRFQTDSYTETMKMMFMR